MKKVAVVFILLTHSINSFCMGTELQSKYSDIYRTIQPSQKEKNYLQLDRNAIEKQKAEAAKDLRKWFNNAVDRKESGSLRFCSQLMIEKATGAEDVAFNALAKIEHQEGNLAIAEAHYTSALLHAKTDDKIGIILHNLMQLYEQEGKSFVDSQPFTQYSANLPAILETAYRAYCHGDPQASKMIVSAIPGVPGRVLATKALRKYHPLVYAFASPAQLRWETIRRTQNDLEMLKALVGIHHTLKEFEQRDAYMKQLAFIHKPEDGFDLSYFADSIYGLKMKNRPRCINLLDAGRRALLKEELN